MHLTALNSVCELHLIILTSFTKTLTYHWLENGNNIFCDHR